MNDKLFLPLACFFLGVFTLLIAVHQIDLAVNFMNINNFMESHDMNYELVENSLSESGIPVQKQYMFGMSSLYFALFMFFLSFILLAKEVRE